MYIVLIDYFGQHLSRMAKRPVVRDVRLRELVRPVLNASVHGILVSVSSMRHG